MAGIIKEALEYITGLKEPVVTQIGGQTYSDKGLNRISYNPRADHIQMSTLTSLVDYIKAGTDPMAEKMLVQVVSPLEVRLVSMLDHERGREELMRVCGNVPDIAYGQYMDHEEFLIALQSKFLPSEDRDKLLRFAGTVKSGTVAEYGDDGVSQKATIRKGVAGSVDAIVPNPVTLFPFRTFIEVVQTGSAFIFRMKEDDRYGVRCAIFEADGGAWRNQAMDSIKGYLQEELKEYGQFTVIA